MTPEKLKKEWPDCYAEIFRLGEAEGARREERHWLEMAKQETKARAGGGNFSVYNHAIEKLSKSERPDGGEAGDLVAQAKRFIEEVRSGRITPENFGQAPDADATPAEKPKPKLKNLTLDLNVRGA